MTRHFRRELGAVAFRDRTLAASRGTTFTVMVKSSERGEYIGFTMAGCDTWVNPPQHLDPKLHVSRHEHLSRSLVPVMRITLKESHDPDSNALMLCCRSRLVRSWIYPSAAAHSRLIRPQASLSRAVEGPDRGARGHGPSARHGRALRGGAGRNASMRVAWLTLRRAGATSRTCQHRSAGAACWKAERR
jgi:hypothetical protein